MLQITVQELRKKLNKSKIELIDVRTIEELEICKIEGSIDIEMNDIPNKASALKKRKTYAVICHSGIRSYRVVEYLNSIGFNAVNVIGGIHAWAVEIDKDMKRY